MFYVHQDMFGSEWMLMSFKHMLYSSMFYEGLTIALNCVALINQEDVERESLQTLPGAREAVSCLDAS